MRKLIRAATTVAATALASGTLVAGLAGTAHSATIPPWEVAQAPATQPAVYPNELGGLTFYNSSGQVITGGNVSTDPIAAYIQGNTALQPHPTLVDLNGFDPTQSGVPVTAPGNWEEEGLGSSSLPSSAPGALGTSSLPVYTGQSYSLSQLTVALPNTDTSTTDGYAGIYVLRLQTFQHNDGNTSTTYDSADISVNSSTGAWTLVYSPQAATTTTLETPTPASPQNAGASVTLTATVADASAPGTVQFESGGSPVGSAQPVVNGTATLTTTALPAGTDSLSAVYTPTTGAAFSGSTSTNSVSYTINAPATVPGAPTIGTATPGNTSASVSFTAPASNGGSAITGYTVTATDTTTPANGGQTGTGATSPISVTGLHNGDSYTFTVTATNGVGTGAASSASNSVTPEATVCNPPTITSAPPTATATVGQSYNFEVTTCTTTGAPKIVAKGLPKGLALVNNGNGTATISGIPRVKDLSSYSGTITATVKGQTAATQSFTITVDQAAVFHSKTKALVYAGQTITTPFEVVTEYAYPAPALTASGLPSGVTLQDNGNGTGDFVGTPGATSGGIYTVTISAANVAGVVQQTFTLTDYQAPTFSNVPASETVTKGTAITPIVVDYAGYPAPLVKAAGLPKGLTASVNTTNDTVTISGTPTTKAVSGTTTLSAKSKGGTTTGSIVFTVN
jgi:large repetitive protein